MDRLAAINVFVAIAEAGSLSAGGRRLGMPLSTVSRYLAALYDFFIFGTAAALIFNEVFFPSFDCGTLRHVEVAGSFASDCFRHLPNPFAETISAQAALHRLVLFRRGWSLS